MKIKIADAPNRAIDWLVAKAEGINLVIKDGRIRMVTTQDMLKAGSWFYEPTTAPAQAWPIIERVEIFFQKSNYPNSGAVFAYIGDPDKMGDPQAFGSNHLDAAMRCYAASVYGEKAEVPDELVD